jgi:transposase
MHALCGAESEAVDIRITAGQAGDAPVGEEMLDAIKPYEGRAQAAMDKAYDSNAIRAKLVAKGIEPVIPPKANRLEIIVYDKEQYKQRNKVERRFNKIKQFRRVATRYEQLKATFLAFVTLALIIIMLR